MRGCAPRPPTTATAWSTIDGDLVTSTLPTTVNDGDVLVRLPARDAAWPTTLPAAPAGHLLTLTLGHPSLLPGPESAALPHGYRLVGVASERRPIGRSVGIYVPATLRTLHPAWWRSLLDQAERVFDLQLGPVQRVLAAELALHAGVSGEHSE